MRYVRDEWHTEQQRGRAALTADPRGSRPRRVDHMQTVANESPAVRHQHCPNCQIMGRPAVWAGQWTAVCHTTWTSDGVVLSTGPACYVIESRNDVIESLRYEIRELRAGIADDDMVDEVAA